MSEITDLAKTIREENEKTRAQQERIASGEGPYAKETVEAAKASLKNKTNKEIQLKNFLVFLKEGWLKQKNSMIKYKHKNK